MELLKNQLLITTVLQDYGGTVKLYNHVASSLVAFETLWFRQWLNVVENAQSGLKAFLLTYQSSSGELRVNADGRVLTLMAEAVMLKRLGLVLPEGTVSVVSRAPQFKTYWRLLEQLLVEYRTVFLKAPLILRSLVSSHAELLLRHIRPGWTGLSWDNVNIDGYVHSVHSATRKMREVVSTMVSMSKSIDQQIASIESTSLYSSELASSRVWVS